MKYGMFLFINLFAVTVFAQHCPYDGGSLIAIKLVNEKGKMITLKDAVYLVEIDNPVADSCTYAQGLLKKTLLSVKDYFLECDERYRQYYSDALKKRLKAKGIIGTANMMVSINQAETNCMIKNNNDFDYRERKFVVSVYYNKKEHRVAVPQNAVRSLCTATNALDNFKPVVVQL